MTRSELLPGPLADWPATDPMRRPGRGRGIISRFNESVGVCQVPDARVPRPERHPWPHDPLRRP